MAAGNLTVSVRVSWWVAPCLRALALAVRAAGWIVNRGVTVARGR